jgi:hypothetical protein
MTDFTAADATAITQARVQTDVATAVAQKRQDQQKLQGQAVLSLLDAAAQVAQQPTHPGKGLTLDATA